MTIQFCQRNPSSGRGNIQAGRLNTDKDADVVCLPFNRNENLRSKMMCVQKGWSSAESRGDFRQILTTHRNTDAHMIYTLYLYIFISKFIFLFKERL